MTCPHAKTETYTNVTGKIARCTDCGYVTDVVSASDTETAKNLDELSNAYYAVNQ